MDKSAGSGFDFTSSKKGEIRWARIDPQFYFKSLKRLIFMTVVLNEDPIARSSGHSGRPIRRDPSRGIGCRQ